MPDIIFIPGLGADERQFEFIETGNNKKHFVKWVKPDDDELSPSRLLPVRQMHRAIAAGRV